MKNPTSPAAHTRIALIALWATGAMVACSQPTSPGHLFRVASAAGEPIPGAWVVVSAEADENGDGKIDAASGFTNAGGQLWLEIPREGDSMLVNAVAGGHKSSVRRHMNSADLSDGWTCQVELEESAGVVFWGQLTGLGTGGAAVELGEPYGPPDAVTDSEGRFALTSVGSFFRCTIHSSVIEETNVSMESFQQGSYLDPNRFQVSGSPEASLALTVAAANGSLPASKCLLVYYASLEEYKDERPGWRLARKSSAAAPSFSLTGFVDRSYVVLAVDGTRWSAKAIELQPGAAVRLELPNQGRAAIEALTSTRDSRPFNGRAITVDVRISNLSLPGSEPSPVIARLPIEQDFMARISGLLDGWYELQLFDQLHSAYRVDVVQAISGTTSRAKLDFRLP